MFNNQKYITKGINEQLPLELQIYLWNMIGELQDKIELDYLQVFRLSTINKDGRILQQITHTQEVPPYKNTVIIRISKPISNRKIFCIDDDTHSTMLFAEEY